MKTSGKCVVGIENKKGDVWQVALDRDGQSFVIAALEQYFDGNIKVIDNKLPLSIPTYDTTN